MPQDTVNMEKAISPVHSDDFLAHVDYGHVIIDVIHAFERRIFQKV